MQVPAVGMSHAMHTIMSVTVTSRLTERWRNRQQRRPRTSVDTLRFTLHAVNHWSGTDTGEENSRYYKKLF